MAAAPYIGSRITLLSKSHIRYEGILYTINMEESTIALQNGACCAARTPACLPAGAVQQPCPTFTALLGTGQDVQGHMSGRQPD